jgi:hypothetical protein
MIYSWQRRAIELVRDKVMTSSQVKKQKYEAAIEIESLKDSLSRKHNLARDKRFDKAFEISWREGHADDEVEQWFEELSELINPEN